MKQFDDRTGMIVGDDPQLPPEPANDGAGIMLKPSKVPVGRLRAGVSALLICLAAAIGRFSVAP